MLNPSRPDPPLGILTRVIMELGAWVTTPWALYELGRPALAWVVGIGLVLIPAVFSTPGDKKFCPSRPQGLSDLGSK